MKKLLCALMALTAWVAQTRATDGITIADANIPKGGEAVVEVSLISADKSYGGFQFDVKLPAGVSLVKVEKADRLTAIENYTLQKSLTDETNNIYTVLGYNTDRQNIAGTSGVVAYLTLQASSDMALGDAPDAIVDNVVLSTINEENIDAASSSFSITIEENDGRVVLDETSTTAPEASDGEVNVLVKRTIKANEWSTICLPFAMDATQVKAAFGNDVQLADADSYETTEDGGDIVGINIKFNNATAIEANHPYIIKVSSAITSFVVDGVVVAPADKERNRRTSLGSGSYFVGNYVSQTAVPEFCLFLSGNKFWYSVGDTKMKAFRGYFDLKDVLTDVEDAYGSRIIMSFGEATGINTIDHSPFTIDHYYDLQGRKVENPGKGIYLKTCKKVVVK